MKDFINNGFFEGDMGNKTVMSVGFVVGALACILMFVGSTTF